MKMNRIFLFVTLVLSASLAMATPKKVALLVGVGNAPSIKPPLEGPVHDVAALQDVLVKRWGFAARDVKSLTEREATYAAITRELKALVQRTAPGDEVFLYLSGHGTSSLQPGKEILPDGSGAFYAFDADQKGDNLLVGRADIRPVLEQLDKGGRKVWFVADTCFSGNMARNYASSTGVAVTQRLATLIDDKNLSKILLGVRDNAPKQRESDWPYQNVVFLAASASGEPAVDIRSEGLSKLPTVDNKPHGAFTDALLRVLDGSLPADVNRDGSYSLQEIYETVSLFMSSRPYGQQPQRFPAFKDDRKGLAQVPLLRGATVRTPPERIQPAPVRVHVRSCLAKSTPVALEAIRRVPGVMLANSFDATTPVALSMSGDGKRLFLLAADGGVVTVTSITEPDAMVGSLQQMVWVTKIESMARSGRRAVLEAEISPVELGVTRVIGDKLALAVFPDRDAHLMVINVNSMGEVSVVYPYREHEIRKLPRTTVTQLAGFPVEPPEGTDVQLWFAFDQLPDTLSKQLNRLNMRPGDARLLELERLIDEQKGRYAFARTEFRTYTQKTLSTPITEEICE